MSSRISFDEGIAISQIIVNILQRNTTLDETLEKTDSNVYITSMQNCREQGFAYWVYGNRSKKSFTWCTYQHRNSDSIIVNGKEGMLTNSGDLPYTSNDKHIYLSGFSYSEYEKAADFLANQIIDFVLQESESVK